MSDFVTINQRLQDISRFGRQVDGLCNKFQREADGIKISLVLAKMQKATELSLPFDNRMTPCADGETIQQRSARVAGEKQIFTAFGQGFRMQAEENPDAVIDADSFNAVMSLLKKRIGYALQILEIDNKEMMDSYMIQSDADDIILARSRRSRQPEPS